MQMLEMKQKGFGVEETNRRILFLTYIAKYIYIYCI